MKNRIETINKKLLIGKFEEMSFVEDKTGLLWQSFMKSRKEVKNRLDTFYYSMQIYNEKFDYENFNPAKKFVKWAAVEVTDSSEIPENMESYVLAGGTYAVFIHVGPASEFVRSMKFIFEEWLPESGCVVDDREHFGILPEGYNPLDENATEEIWIPIVSK